MLAVIPARGGSKGIPRKNIKQLNGKPLIAYTIEAAIQSNVFETVIVSTDDPTIAEQSRQYGADAPFLRPPELSGDDVSSDDVILHAIEFFKRIGKQYSSVCKLQPTSPLRGWKEIQSAYQLFVNKNLDYVVSVCECEHSPLWSGPLDEKHSLEHFIREDAKRACRQSMQTYYRLNGAIYMGKTHKYCENKSFLGKNGEAFIMTQAASIDIDSPLDFYIAECIMRQKERQNHESNSMRL